MENLAGAFTYAGVADAYQFRPPYPVEVFEVLERLIAASPRTVLDIGAGQGALARPLAARVDRVDALDVAAVMIDAGRGQPGGEQPNLRWIVGAIETTPLDGPYALVTAGASLHWMDWLPTMERLAGAMVPGAYLAIVEHGPRDMPWRADLTDVIVRHSRNPDYDPRFSLPDALAEQGLFEIVGRIQTAPVEFRQPVADYIQQFHSTSTLAREWMEAAEVAEFDGAIEHAVRPYAIDGMLTMAVVADITWGTPRL